MNLEDFRKEIKLKYTFGINTTTGASRRYHDSKMRIGSEVHTPKNEDGEWGIGERIYYFEDCRKEFSSIEDLYNEYIKRQSK